MEVKVEPKRRMVWPWIVGAVALGVLVWALVDRPYGDDELDAGGTPGDAARVGDAGVRERAAAPAEVVALASFVDETQLEMGPGHDYTAEGLRRLGAALEVLSRDADDQARARQEGFAQAAVAIQQDPASAQHADRVRTAMLAAADAIEAIGRHRGDAEVLERRVAALRDTARSVDGAKLLLEQRQPVQRFFEQSAELLQQLAT